MSRFRERERKRDREIERGGLVKTIFGEGCGGYLCLGGKART